MGYAEEIGFDSASHPSRRGSDADDEDRTRRWRAPVITRLSVERTLFFVNSPTDAGSNGSTIG